MTESDHGNLPAGPRSAKYGHLRLSLSRGPAVGTDTAEWTQSAASILDPSRAAEARREMRTWPGYASTPLTSLPGLDERLGVSEVRCKDESSRFGIGSFATAPKHSAFVWALVLTFASVYGAAWWGGRRAAKLNPATVIFGR